MKHLLVLTLIVLFALIHIGQTRAQELPLAPRAYRADCAVSILSWGGGRFGQGVAYMHQSAEHPSGYVGACYPNMKTIRPNVPCHVWISHSSAPPGFIPSPAHGSNVAMYGWGSGYVRDTQGTCAIQ